MMQLTSTLAVAAVLLLHLADAVQIEMPQSVLGSGGVEASDPDNILIGTLGQTVIGVASGPSNILNTGFWSQPGWILTGVEEPEALLPTEFRLEQNHPNPFNPLTTLEFAVPKEAHVTVKLYDVTGRVVRELVDREMDPGFHRAVVNAAGLPGGVYICRMESGGFSETRRLVLLK